jgi:hypothetical protein
MKHTVKAKVLTISTESACRFLDMSLTPKFNGVTLGVMGGERYPSKDQSTRL